MEIDFLEKIKKSLKCRFEYEFIVELRLSNDIYEIVLTPSHTSLSEGFQIISSIGWKTITCQFNLGNKAGLLLLAMGNSSEENKKIFCSVAENVRHRRGSVNFVINKNSVNPEDYEAWPIDWFDISLSMTSTFTETEGDLSEDNELSVLVSKWTGIFFSMIYPLLPLVETDCVTDFSVYGNYEGSNSKALINQYERNRKNRQACLAVNGYKCKICKFDYEEKYGSIGSGYIEVHHIIPLSSVGGSYLINPVKDLVPLCANCHAMIHRRNPPFSLEELQNIINKSSNW